jgi:hypothetical protein
MIGAREGLGLRRGTDCVLFIQSEVLETGNVWRVDVDVYFAVRKGVGAAEAEPGVLFGVTIKSFSQIWVDIFQGSIARSDVNRDVSRQGRKELSRFVNSWG